MARPQIIRCPNCGEEIEMDEYTEIGDIITCHYCSAELEVKGKHPFRVKLFRVTEEEEDSEDYGNEDYRDYLDNYYDENE